MSKTDSKRFSLSRDDLERRFTHVMQIAGLTIIAVLEQIQQGKSVDPSLMYFWITFLLIDLIKKRMVHNPKPWDPNPLQDYA